MRRKQGAGSKSGFLASTRLQRAPVLQEARLPRLPLDAKRVGTEAGTPAAGVRTAVQAHARGALRVGANAQEHRVKGGTRYVRCLPCRPLRPLTPPNVLEARLPALDRAGSSSQEDNWRQRLQHPGADRRGESSGEQREREEGENR